MTKAERKKDAKALAKLISKEIHKVLERPDTIFDKNLEEFILPELMSNDEKEVLEGFKGGIPWNVIGRVEWQWSVEISRHQKAKASRPLVKQLHEYYKKVSHEHVILYRACVADISPNCAGKDIPRYIDAFQVRFRKATGRFEITTYCKACLRERQKYTQREYRKKLKASNSV